MYAFCISVNVKHNCNGSFKNIYLGARNHALLTVIGAKNLFEKCMRNIDLILQSDMGGENEIMLVFIRTSAIICKLGQGKQMHVKMSDALNIYGNKMSSVTHLN